MRFGVVVKRTYNILHNRVLRRQSPNRSWPPEGAESWLEFEELGEVTAGTLLLLNAMIGRAGIRK